MSCAYWVNWLGNRSPRKGEEALLYHSQNVFQERCAVGKEASKIGITARSQDTKQLCIFNSISTKKGSARIAWPARVRRAWKEQVPGHGKSKSLLRSVWQSVRAAVLGCGSLTEFGVCLVVSSLVLFCYDIGTIMLTSVPIKTENREGLLWERYRKE